MLCVAAYNCGPTVVLATPINWSFQNITAPSLIATHPRRGFTKKLVTSQPDEEGVIEEDPGDQEGDEQAGKTANFGEVEIND